MAGAVSQNTYPCLICSENCNYASLKCDYCGFWVHYQCSELPNYHLLDLMKSNKKFMCMPCCKKKYDDYDARIKEISIHKEGLNLVDSRRNVYNINNISSITNNENGGNQAELNDSILSEVAITPGQNKLNESYLDMMKSKQKSELKIFLKPATNGEINMNGNNQRHENLRDSRKIENDLKTDKFPTWPSPNKRTKDCNLKNPDSKNAKSINPKATWPNNIPLNSNLIGNSSDNRKASPQLESAPICKHYKRNSCRYGISGKNCRYSHPRICRRLLLGGNDPRKGCSRGKHCNDYHPKMCYTTLKGKTCTNSRCNFTHVSGLRKIGDSKYIDNQQDGSMKYSTNRVSSSIDNTVSSHNGQSDDIRSLILSLRSEISAIKNDIYDKVNKLEIPKSNVQQNVPATYYPNFGSNLNGYNPLNIQPNLSSHPNSDQTMFKNNVPHPNTHHGNFLMAPPRNHVPATQSIPSNQPQQQMWQSYQH